MTSRKIDLSDIKLNDLDKTSSFTDLMSRSERKVYNESKYKTEEEKLEDTRTLRNIKKRALEYELEERKKIEEEKRKKENIQKNIKEEKEVKEETEVYEDNFLINTLGIFNLLSLVSYIYLIVFSNEDISYDNSFIMSIGIVTNIFIYGIASTTSKSCKTIFSILNILSLVAYLLYNLYILFY